MWLQFYLLPYDVEITEPLTVEYIIKGLVLYFTPVDFLFFKSGGAPLNEETARSKKNILCGSFEWLEQVFGFVPWGYSVLKNWRNWTEEIFVYQYA